MHPKTGIRRDRSGCWNCKGRRRKCPEEFPSCSACVRRNLQCDYGVRLVWKDELELLGVTFGRAGLKNRHRRPPKHKEDGGLGPSPPTHYLLPISACSSRFHWLNTTSADVSTACSAPLVSDGRISSGNAGPAERPSLPRQLNDFPDLDGGRSGFLLEYYIRIWSRRQVLSDIFDNPYQRIILPLSQHSPGLADMVIAWASHDIRNQLRDGQPNHYDAVLLYHKSRSLQHVRELLQAGRWATAADRPTRDSLLLTIMLHARLEIASNSTREWLVHLRGALSAVRHGCTVHGRDAFSREVLDFALSCLSMEGIFHATTSRLALRGGESDSDIESYSESESGSDAASSHWPAEIVSLLPPLTERERSHVNGYTGISLEMLQIIASITTAIRRRHRQPAAASSPSSPLYDRLHRLRQWSGEPDSDSLVNVNAAAFEAAAWIYLRHGLLGEPCDSPAIQHQHLPRLLALLQRVHRRRRHPVGSQPYPMWALFVAACVAQEDCRTRVMDCFVELWEQRPYSNVPVTTAAVRAIWKTVDLGWCRPRGGACPGPLVWEEAIHRLGWMMSLT